MDSLRLVSEKLLPCAITRKVRRRKRVEHGLGPIGLLDSSHRDNTRTARITLRSYSLAKNRPLKSATMLGEMMWSNVRAREDLSSKRSASLWVDPPAQFVGRGYARRVGREGKGIWTVGI